MTGVPLLDPVYALVGLDRPLPILSPGLAQPPPGTGDGLRERDIGKLGVPIFIRSRGGQLQARIIMVQRPPLRGQLMRWKKITNADTTRLLVPVGKYSQVFWGINKKQTARQRRNNEGHVPGIGDSGPWG